MSMWRWQPPPSRWLRPCIGRPGCRVGAMDSGSSSQRTSSAPTTSMPAPCAEQSLQRFALAGRQQRLWSRLQGVLVVMGKSFIMKGLAAVFGSENVFYTPQHPNFPLLGLDAAKLALLDDFRFLTSPVPLATQCLWFDGSPVPVAKPQNLQGAAAASHDVYTGSAPIFITTSMSEVELLEQEDDGDASMLRRRLTIFPFTASVPKPAMHIPACASCFARLVCSSV